MSMKIAIDGPAGAGKSTVAKRMAKELGFAYVDTGAMYRAMALHFLRHGIAPEDEKAVEEACGTLSVAVSYEQGQQQVFLEEENVTSLLRTEEVGNMASATSAYACVRAKLLDLQRELASSTDVVMDGRDIGTCVLPDAQVKIYLTASADARAKRRYDELMEKGEAPDYDEIRADIMERDRRDMDREISPLRQAEDAVFLDSSDLGIKEVVARIREIYQERQGWK